MRLTAFLVQIEQISLTSELYECRDSIDTRVALAIEAVAVRGVGPVISSFDD